MHPVVRILTNYYAGESFYPIEFLETRHPENLRAGIKPVKYIYESKVNAVPGEKLLSPINFERTFVLSIPSFGGVNRSLGTLRRLSSRGRREGRG